MNKYKAMWQVLQYIDQVPDSVGLVKCSGKYKVGDELRVYASAPNNSELKHHQVVIVVKSTLEGYVVKDNSGEEWVIFEEFLRRKRKLPVNPQKPTKKRVKKVKRTTTIPDADQVEMDFLKKQYDQLMDSYYANLRAELTTTMNNRKPTGQNK
jgi:hypothetical protein